MNTQTLLILLADFLLILHVLFVAFVIGSVVCVCVGKICRWQWVRNMWFRVSHLIAIAIVIIQSWIGMICPLTTWEMLLRERAGQEAYEGAFIAYWLHTLLYFQAPQWVFAVAYTLFGLLVVATWIWVPPRKKPPSKTS